MLVLERQMGRWEEDLLAPYFWKTPEPFCAEAACLGAWSDSDTAWLRGQETGYCTENGTPHASMQLICVRAGQRMLKEALISGESQLFRVLLGKEESFHSEGQRWREKDCGRQTERETEQRQCQPMNKQGR